MSTRARLERLERGEPEPQCPTCWGNDAVGGIVRFQDPDAAPAACSDCNRRPRVIVHCPSNGREKW